MWGVRERGLMGEEGMGDKKGRRENRETEGEERDSWGERELRMRKEGRREERKRK